MAHSRGLLPLRVFVLVQYRRHVHHHLHASDAVAHNLRALAKQLKQDDNLLQYTRGRQRDKRERENTHLDRAGDGTSETTDDDNVVGLERLESALNDCAE